MFKEAKQFLVRCISPMHAGIGQDLGSVDMPIQRERTTNIPKVESSTFKGSLRASMNDHKYIDLLFGKSSADNGLGAGSIGITDLKLLFYPIKSRDGFYKLVTCSYLLNRFFEDQDLVDKGTSKNNNIKNIKEGNGVELLYESSSYKFSNLDNISLDEYTFQKDRNINELKELKEFFNKIIDEDIKKNIVILNDGDFFDLEELNREIITRNKINQDTGTVQTGVLFTEEYLPSESILYGIFLYSPFNEEINFEDELKYIQEKNSIFQIGGNSNFGKGIVKLKILNLKEK